METENWSLGFGKMEVVRDIDDNILVCYWEGRGLNTWWKWIQEKRVVRDGRCCIQVTLWRGCY